MENSQEKDLKSFNNLLADFKDIEDRDERAELLIELAESYNPPPESIQKKPYPESAKVPGCESEVYVFKSKDEKGRLNYYFAVENPQGISAMALASIISNNLSGVATKYISEVEESFVHDIFGKQLSMGKGQGLTNMVSIIKAFAKRESA